jgi:hypothetical protein
MSQDHDTRPTCGVLILSRSTLDNRRARGALRAHSVIAPEGAIRLGERPRVDSSKRSA